jgi:NitT/TauT family transport system permease protein
MAVDTRSPKRARADADSTITGLDVLELAGRGAGVGRGRRLWAETWPKFGAIVLVLAVWQVLVWSHWKDPWTLPPPVEVFAELGHRIRTATFWLAVATTLQRAVLGFTLAALIGFVLGVAVARIAVLRAAIGSTITGLQTMPSIAWFPLAILLFQLDESAIYFVVILGAAPSIANGVIAGVDYVPPLLLRAGRNIGATGLKLYAYVIAPASLPAIVAGLKQGWAFAWRSLMAGELLVLIPNTPSLGAQLEIARQLEGARAVIAIMIAVFLIGVLADAVFGKVDKAVRRRWGVIDSH